jgi:predicted RND superfamily exporter protein
VVGLAGIFWLNVEVNIQSFFKKGTKIRESLEFLDREMLGTMDMQFYMQGDMKSPEVLNQMVELRKFLEEKPQVSSTLSIAEVIQQMHRSVMDDDPAFETIPDSREKVNNLFTMYSMSGDPDDFSSLVDYDYSSGLTTTMLRNMSSSQIVKWLEKQKSLLRRNWDRKPRLQLQGCW